MFFGSRERSRARRRGVVLILILGMLALMALIGVTFATFAGQQLVNSRNFSQSVNFPSYDQVMDWAMAQLINDTNNPTSAIRGHSLLRDMYGNDSLMTGSAGQINGYLDSIPGVGALTLGLPQLHPTGTGTPYDYTGLLQYPTNIPTFSKTSDPRLAGLNFTRWILTLQPAVIKEPPTGSNPAQVPQVAQSFEVIEDDATGSTSFSGGYHLLTLSPIDPLDQSGLGATPHLSYPRSRIYLDPTLPYLSYLGGATLTPGKLVTFLTQPPPISNSSYPIPGDWPYSGNDARGLPARFTLSCQYMRAFNGPGMTHANGVGLPDATYLGAGQPHNSAAFGNFRTNGGLLHFPFGPSNASPPTLTSFGNPDDYGMDEDYDACDLENWFLAIQSADGQVIIPSFHRPGILTALDWQTPFNGTNNAAAVMSVSKILRPRQVDNAPQFPADPVPDYTTGKITYDLDNDGDGVTDSVWLDLGYPAQRDPRGRSFKPLFAFMVIGLNGRLPLNTAGNLQSRDFQYATAAGGAAPAPFNYPYFPDNVIDGPTWNHASHLGYSVNEVNPLFALQNAPNSVYGNLATPTYTQHDNAGVDVSVTQHRNLVSGTIPQDNLTSPTLTQNFDANYVYVGDRTLPWYMPNSVHDPNDLGYPTNAVRLNTPVPGRWGEPNGIPNTLWAAPVSRTTPVNNIPVNSYVYTNPVRAGKSYAQLGGSSSTFQSTNDGMDDDYDSQDFYPFASPGSPYGFPATITATPNGIHPPSPSEGFSNNTMPGNYWYGDFYDSAVSIQLPVERIRRFVSPIDPSGVGRVVDWSNRPWHGHDYGNGFDRWGRVAYFRYFRPAGAPKAIAYNTPNQTASTFLNADPTGAAAVGDQLYNQPIMMDPVLPDRTNNLFHNWTAAALPIQGIAGSGPEGVAVSGSMPYDMVLQSSLWQSPSATASGTHPPPMTPVPLPTLSATSPSTMTQSINSSQGPFLGPFTVTAPGGSDPVPPLHPVDSAMAGGYPHVSVVNGYPNYPVTDIHGNFVGSSLNKDEADEMNLYAHGLWDMPYGPSDLEWLYRKQDVDGSGLTSRLSQLAPVSFLNPADGLTRRRLFSTDSWDTISYAYAPDNPLPLNGQGQTFDYNSRFAAITNYFPTYNPLGNPNPYASPFIPNASIAAMNYNPHPATYQYPAYLNPLTLANLPNPVAYANSGYYTTGIPTPNATSQPIAYPLEQAPTGASASPPYYTYALATAPTMAPFTLGGTQTIGGNPVTFPFSPAVANGNQLAPVLTQPAAHRERRINLNYPLPVSNDTSEPVRQKWIRETYQLFKAILPPQATDTPQELAQLSQFVVNIIDFRDPDCTATRFVNTDLIVKAADNTGVTLPTLKFADRAIPVSLKNPPQFVVGPYDPTIADIQNLPSTGRDTDWDAAMNYVAATPGIEDRYLVQHGMEYCPLALNEAMAYGWTSKSNGLQTRLLLEVVNMMTDDGTGTPSASDLRIQDIDGWDIVITDDATGYGRPDPITGDVPPFGLLQAMQNRLWASFTAGTSPPPGVPIRPAAPATTPPTPFIPITFTGTINAMTAAGANYFVIGTPTPLADYDNSVPTPKLVTVNGVESPAIATNATIIDSAGKTIALPSLPAGPKQSMFLWAYLRRPANPFDQKAYGTSEMVVVDSIRFPYTISNGTGKTTGTSPNQKDQGTPGSPETVLYSAHRRQPYRGGQMVPPIGSAANLPNPPTAYGYSEQTAGPGPTQSTIYWGNSFKDNGKLSYVDTVQSTFGTANTGDDNPWDYFPFHDRDFMSPAELLIVPGCPPGLFTKQFVETNDITAMPTVPFPLGPLTASVPGTLQPIATIVQSTGPPPPPATRTYPVYSPKNSGTLSNFAERYATSTMTTPPTIIAHTYPYLNDEFFYTAASVLPAQAAVNANHPYPIKAGNLTGDGWFKMLEFVEVPSSANGSIGPVAAGANFDWARQDLKPGLINLNLIVDEEVFFGLIDDGRMNIDLAALTSNLPQVVSQIDANGYPSHTGTAGSLLLHGAYPISNIVSPTATPPLVGRGYTYTNPLGVEVTGLKAAFSDFLKLRHGGSGYLFGFGSGLTGSGPAPNFAGTAPTANTLQTPLALERPFRSLSYPDINYTIMRPATLPPSPTVTINGQSVQLTSQVATFSPPYQYFYPPNAAEYGNYLANASGTVIYPDPTMPVSFVGDPGVRNPFISLPLPPSSVMTSGQPKSPFSYRGAPLIPPRRLFGIPDMADGVAALPVSGNAEFPNNYVYQPNQPITSEQLSGFGTANLFSTFRLLIPQGAPSGTTPVQVNQYLGAGLGAGTVNDYRQHPYYRSEMLQKVMNLTTVRTHQFAVWLTVGFFEVTQVGSPALGIPDVLGGELGLLAGKNVRYRAFFVLDRTRSVGFNVQSPADFRNVVAYRRRIE